MAKYELLSNAFEKFCSKSGVTLNNVYFMYLSTKLDNNSNQRIGDFFVNTNDIKILVFDSKSETNHSEEQKLKESKDFICPLCKNTANIHFNGYNISVNNCSEKHNLTDLSIDKLIGTQLIDENKISCSRCSESKVNSIRFYYCNDCGKNLCSSCLSKHYYKHNIVNYNEKNFFCKEHGEKFVDYCDTCEENLCMLCTNSHFNQNSKISDKIN